MKLEQAIQQEKFASESHKAFLNVLYASSLINTIQLRFFKQHSLSPEQYNVLRILRGQYPQPAKIGLLQERMLDKMSNASRLVEKLKQKELLTRTACCDDRRQMDVLITKKGLDLLKKLDPDVNLFNQKIKGISETDFKHLNAILDKLCIELNT